MHVTPGIARRRSTRQRRALLERRAKRRLVRPIARQRRGDGVLHRDGAAQAAVRQLPDRRRHVVEARRAPTAIQPVRQPGARYAFDRLENEMIAASGSKTADRRHRAVVAEIAVNLVGQHRETVPLGEIDQLHVEPASDNWRRLDCSDRSRPARALPV